jgi:hypothetical protein
MRPLYQHFQFCGVDRLALSFDEWQKNLEALVGKLQIEVSGKIIIIVRIGHHHLHGWRDADVVRAYFEYDNGALTSWLRRAASRAVCPDYVKLSAG